MFGIWDFPSPSLVLPLPLGGGGYRWGWDLKFRIWDFVYPAPLLFQKWGWV